MKKQGKAGSYFSLRVLYRYAGITLSEEDRQQNSINADALPRLRGAGAAHLSLKNSDLPRNSLNFKQQISHIKRRCAATA